MGIKPSVMGMKPSVTGIKPSVMGIKPSVAGIKPSVAGIKPSVAGIKPSGYQTEREGEMLLVLTVFVVSNVNRRWTQMGTDGLDAGQSAESSAFIRVHLRFVSLKS